MKKLKLHPGAGDAHFFHSENQAPDEPHRQSVTAQHCWTRVNAMTAQALSGMAVSMLRHWGLFLLGLLAFSLMATATVHAREALGAPAISCSGETHAEGDRDQVPADADQGAPHHHGACHGHAFALQVDTQAAEGRQHESSQIFARRGHSLASLSIDPTLRPPRA